MSPSAGSRPADNRSVPFGPRHFVAQQPRFVRWQGVAQRRRGRKNLSPRPGSRTRSATDFPAERALQILLSSKGKCSRSRRGCASFRCRRHRDRNRLLAGLAPTIARRITSVGSGLAVTTDRVDWRFPALKAAGGRQVGVRVDGSIGCGEVSGDGFRMRSEPRPIGPRRRRWRCADRSRGGRLLLWSPVRRAHRGTPEAR